MSTPAGRLTTIPHTRYSENKLKSPFFIIGVWVERTYLIRK